MTFNHCICGNKRTWTHTKWFKTEVDRHRSLLSWLNTLLCMETKCCVTWVWLVFQASPTALLIIPHTHNCYNWPLWYVAETLPPPFFFCLYFSWVIYWWAIFCTISCVLTAYLTAALHNDFPSHWEKNVGLSTVPPESGKHAIDFSYLQVFQACWIHI